MQSVVASERVSFECHDLPRARCPNCAGRGMRRFYRIAGIPAHSCLLMPTREQALRYPQRDLELAVCPACGFIGNIAFDASVHEYSPTYEETQGFSPTFSDFARALARQLVDRYRLQGKTVLEIGCGKGEFLEAMCEFGVGKGIGIDPAYVPQRRTSPAAKRMEVIQDLYSEDYAHLSADMIVCRHTLEHIHQTLAFLQTIRRSIDGDRETLLFFEVPDAVRVMREGAFWDIYYEHCSYFSPASLARAFRLARFEVTDLTRTYRGQYLLITAVPTDERTRPALPMEQEHASATLFGTAGPRVADHWRRVVDQYARRGRRIVLWGSGSKGVALLTTLGITDQIEHVVDINPYRHGKYMPGTGQRIVAPEFLQTCRPDLVIIMNPVYEPEITATLDRLGVDAQCVTV
ncbi:MAG: class I SAM-dependent methyltransferase [Phycisphaeraceae bacterium]